MQGWLSFWFQQEKRLDVARAFQKARIDYLKRVWSRDKELKNENFYCDDRVVEKALHVFADRIAVSQTVEDLLSHEAHLTKQLYKYAVNIAKLENFSRKYDAGDLANNFLNHGNYLASIQGP